MVLFPCEYPQNQYQLTKQPFIFSLLDNSPCSNICSLNKKQCNYKILIRCVSNPVNTGRKLNVHKTFRRCPGRLLNVLCTFNLRPVSTGNDQKQPRFHFYNSCNEVFGQFFPVSIVNAAWENKSRGYKSCVTSFSIYLNTIPYPFLIKFCMYMTIIYPWYV